MRIAVAVTLARALQPQRTLRHASRLRSAAKDALEQHTERVQTGAGPGAPSPERAAHNKRQQEVFDSAAEFFASPEASPPEVEATLDALEAYLKAIFDRVDYNHDGQVSRIEAIKALRKDDEFARMLGFAHHTHVRQEDGTRDKLMLAFGALDENEDKMLSFEEFRHASLVALSSVAAPPPPASGVALGAAGPPTPPVQMGSGDMNAKL